MNLLRSGKEAPWQDCGLIYSSSLVSFPAANGYEYIIAPETLASLVPQQLILYHDDHRCTTG
jgi:hypothetical protein